MKLYHGTNMDILQDEEGELYVQSPAYLYELMNIQVASKYKDIWFGCLHVKTRSRNNELFSSISSINSNLKGLTKHQKIQKQNNKQNNNNNLINSSEFDVVNTDEYKITKNEVTLNTETDFNIENNTEFKELIELNTKDDFKIEHNPETGSNSIFQDKTSLFESMINLNLQQSKSLISVTQKNDIEVTQVEEYDQDKYKQQNETKEINFSSILNTTPNNNIIQLDS